MYNIKSYEGKIILYVIAIYIVYIVILFSTFRTLEIETYGQFNRIT